jgi:hypothetical protein
MKLDIQGTRLRAQLLNPKREDPNKDYSQLCVNGGPVLKSSRLISSTLNRLPLEDVYDIEVRLLDKDKVHYVWMENGLEDHIWARFEDGKLREMTKEEYKGILR